MKNILLIDSGTGGMNVLLKCLEVCPCGNFLLFCDNANLPYGTKRKKELEELTLENLEMIRKFFDFDIVVFACNTLTSTAIELCRERFPDIIFVGTEPAIKSALLEFDEKEICVLATETTIQTNKLIGLHKKITCKAIESLASKIDNNLSELETLKGFLFENLKDVKQKAVVLGCTHYVSLLPIMQHILPNVKFFSSEEGVAKRLKSILEGGGVLECGNFQVQIITSQNNDFLAKLKWYFNEKSKDIF